jgi:TRAP-type mannitol/chloroaromatic compound transport system permease large subunit
MVTGVIQATVSLGILVPSVVLVLYAMIVRQPVGSFGWQGHSNSMMAALFYHLHCRAPPDKSRA